MVLCVCRFQQYSGNNKNKNHPDIYLTLVHICLSSKRPEPEHIVVFCSWVTPDTKITRCAKQLVDADSKLFQGPPIRELHKMEEKSFMLHSVR